ERSSSPAWFARGRRGSNPPAFRGVPVPRAICDLVPEYFAREYQIFPIGEEGETLRLAAVDHANIGLSDSISFQLSRPVRLIAASRDEVEALLKQYYLDQPDSEATEDFERDFLETAPAAGHHLTTTMSHLGDQRPASLRARTASRAMAAPRGRAE